MYFRIVRSIMLDVSSTSFPVLMTWNESRGQHMFLELQ